jgi:hypothetical protein
MTRLLIASFVLLNLFVSSAKASADTYYVYYLGGQSNMDGYGEVAGLPKALNTPVDGVYIFHGNPAADRAPGRPLQSMASSPGGSGLWTRLQPGHGAGFTSDGKANTYGSRFGVELSFALGMQSKHPERKIALIKYSRGGTAISSASESALREDFGCWATTSANPALSGREHNQFDHFLTTLRNAFADRDIDGDGKLDTLIPAGILWMQGESDAMNEDVALAYESNLAQLMGLIRAALRVDDLPVVIGRISDSAQGEGKDGRVWAHGALVRAAQAKFCERDGFAALVTSTDDYGYSDPWHYDTDGFLDLGERFANSMAKLELDTTNKSK